MTHLFPLSALNPDRTPCSQPAMSAPSKSAPTSALEEMKTIDEEYKIWKKNSPFLCKLKGTSTHG